MAHWDEERRLILSRIEADAVVLIDMDRVLYACQEAIGDTDWADPITAASSLVQVQADGSDLDWLDAIGMALTTAQMMDRERQAALFGAFQMARAFLWVHGQTDD